MTIANPNLFAHSGDAKASTESSIRLRKLATYASVATALVLVVTKLAAYLLTDSVSLLSSLVDSTMDGFASLIMMVGMWHATQPADKEHRFGHGKYEALASMAQAVFIFAAGIFLVYEALHRFVTPQPIQHSAIGIGVMVFAIVLTIMLMVFQRYVIRKTQSIGIAADSLHYAGDLFINLSVIAAIVLTHYFSWPYFDPVFAVIIALILLRGAWQIGAGSIGILADKEFDESQRNRIYQLVLAVPGVEDMHDLRTRSSGLHDFIELHIEIDGSMSVRKAHDITEQIEASIYDEFENAEVLIHPEPLGINDERLDDRLVE